MSSEEARRAVDILENIGDWLLLDETQLRRRLVELRDESELVRVDGAFSCPTCIERNDGPLTGGSYR
jgi:hypothetical protein